MAKAVIMEARAAVAIIKKTMLKARLGLLLYPGLELSSSRMTPSPSLNASLEVAGISLLSLSLSSIIIRDMIVLFSLFN